MLVAVVLVAAPPPDGVKVTVTPLARIVPAGKPEPVTDSAVTPACPAVGAAAEDNVTCAWASAGKPSKSANSRARLIAKIRGLDCSFREKVPVSMSPPSHRSII